MEITLEKMAPQHLEAVQAIEVVSYPTPWSRHAFLGEIEENEFAHYYVCRERDTVVGYGGMWLIFDECHVTNITVHPERRNQGIGRLVLKWLLDTATALGAHRATLEVRPSNLPAQRLYRGLGFAPVGVRKGYYSDTHEDAIIMWCNLPHQEEKSKNQSGSRCQ